MSTRPTWEQWTTAERTYRDRAACTRHDPDLFFPVPTDILSINAAKTVCGNCPVRTDCLNEALADPALVGIWGGTTTHERASITGRTVHPKAGVA